jgi:hypothetical protein
MPRALMVLLTAAAAVAVVTVAGLRAGGAGEDGGEADARDRAGRAAPGVVEVDGTQAAYRDLVRWDAESLVAITTS